MNPTAFNILIVISIILSIAGIIKPQWTLIAVAILLIGIEVLIGK